MPGGLPFKGKIMVSVQVFCRERKGMKAENETVLGKVMDLEMAHCEHDDGLGRCNGREVDQGGGGAMKMMRVVEQGETSKMLWCFNSWTSRTRGLSRRAARANDVLLMRAEEPGSPINFRRPFGDSLQTKSLC